MTHHLVDTTCLQKYNLTFNNNINETPTLENTMQSKLSSRIDFRLTLHLSANKYIMSHKRLIYASLFENKRIGKLSSDAILVYICSIIRADDFGRCKFTSPYLRSNTFHFTDKSIKEMDKLVDEIIQSGLVLPYEHDEETYIAHPQFHKYQTLSVSRMKKEFPDPPAEISEVQGQYWEDRPVSYQATLKYGGRIKYKSGKYMAVTQEGEIPLDRTTKCSIPDKGIKIDSIILDEATEIELPDLPEPENKIVELEEVQDTVRILDIGNGNEIQYGVELTFGNEEINNAHGLITSLTNRTLSNTKVNRRHIKTLMSRLEKKNPELDPLVTLFWVIKSALNSKDRWHNTKCHDPKYLKDAFEEILATTQVAIHKQAETKINNPFAKNGK